MVVTIQLSCTFKLLNCLTTQNVSCCMMRVFNLAWKAVICLNFFWFKQKTAYELRISDLSSDVCSSDRTRQRHVQPLGTSRNRGLVVEFDPAVGDQAVIADQCLRVAHAAAFWSSLTAYRRVLNGSMPTRRQQLRKVS